MLDLKNGFLDHYETRGYSYYVVRLARGQEIGVCGFLKKPYLEHEDFGFAFLPAYQGQGYGFEAGRAILDFGIRQFGFSALDAVTVPDNEASIRLLEKLGFVYLGPVEEPDTKTQLCLYHWTGKSRNH